MRKCKWKLKLLHHLKNPRVSSSFWIVKGMSLLLPFIVAGLNPNLFSTVHRVPSSMILCIYRIVAVLGTSGSRDEHIPSVFYSNHSKHHIMMRADDQTGSFPRKKLANASSPRSTLPVPVIIWSSPNTWVCLCHQAHAHPMVIAGRLIDPLKYWNLIPGYCANHLLEPYDTEINNSNVPAIPCKHFLRIFHCSNSASRFGGLSHRWKAVIQFRLYPGLIPRISSRSNRHWFFSFPKHICAVLRKWLYSLAEGLLLVFIFLLWFISCRCEIKAMVFYFTK